MHTTINADSHCYVYHHDGYVTTRSFESLWKETKALAELLDCPHLGPEEQEMGTYTVLGKHTELLAQAQGRDLGTFFHLDTPTAVREILEQARKDGTRLRLFYGDTETGRDWLEEYDLLGRIGRSTGILKVPLLIAGKQRGGPAILDHCIVRIIDVDAQRELFRIWNYHLPQFTVRYERGAQYKAAVYADGDLHARFATPAKAYAWIAFMQGDAFQQGEALTVH